MAINVTVMSIDFDSFEEPINKTFFKNEISIGRDSSNDLVLDRPEISYAHVKIYVKKDADNQNYLMVQDLGSSNGTMVERDQLDSGEEVEIHQNQRLIIGTYLIKPTLVEEEKSNFASINDIKEAFDKPLEVSKEDNIIIEEENYLDEEAEVEETHIAFTPEESKVTAEPIVLPEEKVVVEEIAVAPVAEEVIVEEEKIEPVIVAKTEDISTSTSNIIKEVASNIAKIIISDSDQNLSFEAAELFNLKGRIFSNGAMLSGVSINGGALGTSVSDENGKFIFQNIEESTNYNLVISKDGYTFEANGLSGIIDSEKEIEIKAYKLHSISGKILYKGSALSGVAVEIPNIGTTVSGTDGSFKFENIRFGSNYQIRLHKDKFKFDLLEGTGIVDRDINLTINSTKLVNISGKIIHKGKPVEGVEIECVNIGKTKSNEDGSYTIENVPEGQEYTLKASKVGFVFKPSKAIN